MPTTTNYGWTTPADTDLVKDGASAIRTLGSSIDTTTKALNPSTTLGDIEYRSSTANTNTRLAIGTSGQVLTVNGGVPSWQTSSSGSQTVLATGSLSSTSVSITSISQSYSDLRLYIYDLSESSTGGNNFRFTLNSDTSAIYGYNFSRVGGQFTSSGQNSVPLSAPLNTNSESKMIFNFYDYTNTVASKTGDVNLYFNDYYSNPQMMYGIWFGQTTSAISSIQLEIQSGSFATGTYTLVGIK